MHGHGYRDHSSDFAGKGIKVFGVNDRSPEDAAAWVEREGLPYRVLSDPDRAMGLAYGISKPDAERYVANNAEGRRPAVIIDEQGKVLRVLPDLMSPAQQLEILQDI